MKGSIAVKEEYLDIMKIFGDIQDQANFAFRHFIIDRICEKIDTCQKSIQEYESKYQMKYSEFQEKVSMNEEFVKKLNRTHPTWENDLIIWEAHNTELERWKNYLNSILTT
ncbi:MAG: hypothetical protein AB1567_01645 [bacterium]